jgi:hypothetical protein
MEIELMSEISFMLNMSASDKIAALGATATALTFLIAAITFWWTWRRYRGDQLRQRAAQTREDLQAIIRGCNLFLHPLNQKNPYPILHTATAITKEFCSHMGASPRREDVLALFSNKKLLLSICVEGWISSEQILHMMDIVEKVEYKASSHNLQGKLVLIREASFLLAGLVAEVCSPESFYTILCQLEPHKSRKDEVEDIFNSITIELQHSVCKTFNDNYKDKIERSLYFIQTAANMFIGLKDRQLRHLAETQEVHAGQSIGTNLNKKVEDPIVKIKKEGSPLGHYKKVKKFLDDLKQDIGDPDYQQLCELIVPLKALCEQYERPLTNTLEERAMVNVG